MLTDIELQDRIKTAREWSPSPYFILAKCRDYDTGVLFDAMRVVPYDSIKLHDVTTVEGKQDFNKELDEYIQDTIPKNLVMLGWMVLTMEDYYMEANEGGLLDD